MGDCFRFNPFEHELISLYLKPKVLGQTLLCNVVEETELYGGPTTNPWQVFDPETHPWILCEVSTGKFEKLAYVFVNLTRKAVNSNNKKKQFIKKAGCGTWDGQTKRTPIRDFDGNLIGERRMLVFEINDTSGLEDFSRLGHWRMHEYSLCGVNKDIPNPANIVLCKITLDPSKTPAMKLLPNKTQKNDTVNMDANVCSSSLTNSNVVTTQSCCDAGLVSIDFYGPKGGEEDFCPPIDEDWLNNIYVSDQGEGVNFEEQLIDDFTDEDWLNGIYVSDQGEGVNFEEQLIDDFTTYPGKRKLHVETSFAMKLYYFSTHLEVMVHQRTWR